MKSILRIFISFSILFSLWKGQEGGCLHAQANRIWATYYGGTSEDYGTSVATDSSGNVYLAGVTDCPTGIASGGFQNTLGGASDAFLVKFDAAGNRLWATYYGGANLEVTKSVSTDVFGNVYLAGYTTSANNIASGGFQNAYAGGGPWFGDAFLVKFDGATGNRLWATYYGGTGDDLGHSVATDAAGNVYLAGRTESTSGIASGGFQNAYAGGLYYDAYLVKFDAAGNRIWATYYGGAANDDANGVATDASGNVYLAGLTQSKDSIASGGSQNALGGGGTQYDAFLVKFDAATGNRIWGTYYGGTGIEHGYSVATDILGNVFLAGDARSVAGISYGGFQNVIGGGTDAFLVKFNTAGTRLWATYYGGTAREECYSVTTDVSGNVYLAGDTYSDSNIASGGFQSNLSTAAVPENENEFVVKFNASGARLCATYYGQTHDEDGHVAVDGLGNVYLSGTAISTSGIASGGFQNTFGGGGHDAYLVKFGLNATTTSANVICFGQCSGTATAVGLGSCTPPYTYSWNTLPVQTTQIATGLCSGTYTVTVTDASGASITTTVAITQPLSALATSVTSNKLSCNGQCNGNATVTPSGGTPGYMYSWNTVPVQTSANATGLCPGNYSCVITDSLGCATTQTITVTESSAIILTANSINNTNCITPTGTAIVNASGGTLGYTYSWVPAGGSNSVAIGLVSGTYTATVTDAMGCSGSQTVSIAPGPTLGKIHLPNAFSPNNDGENDEFCLQGGIEYCIQDLAITIYDRWGESVYKSAEKNFCWDGTYKGNPQNTAVFVYYLDVTLMSGETITKKGNISLMR